MSPNPLLQLQGITKRFPGTDRDILAGVDLDIAPGQSLAILGPSGCGKSTLLNILGGLLPPTSGTVRVGDTDLAKLSADDLAAFRNREIGFVFQAHHLLPQCTAVENVLIPTLADGGDRGPTTTARARELLAEVGLGDRLDHRPDRLSGGECQRVAVVRALIHQPAVVLADEPTGSLDEESADHLGELLCRLNRERDVALVTVTHASRLAARMQSAVELRDGSLRASSTTTGADR